MALIELTPDDLCAAISYPFPCEEGTIIDPIAVAHALGLVETGAGIFESASSAAGSKPGTRASKADPRQLLLSLACSLEASQAVARSKATGEADQSAGSIKDSLDAFTDGVIASPPVLTTEFPPAGTVIVIGTVVITIPTPPPVPPEWKAGEQLKRTELLGIATRFQSASKMPGIGETAEALTDAAARLFEAAISR